MESSFTTVCLCSLVSGSYGKTVATPSVRFSLGTKGSSLNSDFPQSLVHLWKPKRIGSQSFKPSYGQRLLTPIKEQAYLHSSSQTQSAWLSDQYNASLSLSHRHTGLKSSNVWLTAWSKDLVAGEEEEVPRNHARMWDIWSGTGDYSVSCNI